MFKIIIPTLESPVEPLYCFHYGLAIIPFRKFSYSVSKLLNAFLSNPSFAIFKTVSKKFKALSFNLALCTIKSNNSYLFQRQLSNAWVAND